MRILVLLTLLLCLVPGTAQEPASADKPASTPPAKAPALTGEWEIHMGGRATGIVIEVNQTGTALTATYKEIPANNRYGIRPGFDFFNATISGTGSMTVRKGDVTKGKPVEKTQSPFRFTLEDEGRRLVCEMQSEEIRETERKFQLVRQQAVKNLRLFVRTPGGYEPATTVIENMPMVVVVEMGGDTRRPTEVTLSSGSQSLTLAARPGDEDKPEEGLPPGFLMTRAFMPTFGMALGVAGASPTAEEAPPAGREATADDWKQIVGTWRTLYKDGVLGNISGWAEVVEDGSLSLSYLPPDGGDAASLQLRSARVLGEVTAAPPEGKAEQTPPPASVKLPKLQLEFEGQGVVSPKISALSADDLVKFTLDAEKPDPVTLKAGDVDASLQVTRSKSADRQKVTLELVEIEPNGVLIWEWHYEADRATQRDAEGFGRVGLMQPGEVETSTGRMAGREAWARNAPRIITAYCTDDQLGLDPDNTWEGRPLPKYRVGDKTLVSRPTAKPDDAFWMWKLYKKWTSSSKPVKEEAKEMKLAASEDSDRTIFIVGTDLPPGSGDSLRLEAEGGVVTEYRILARGKNGQTDDARLKTEWAHYESSLQAAADRAAPQGVPAAPNKPEKDAEGVLARATIKARATPGPQNFALNGAKGSWKLLYGDATGRFMISRTLAKSQAAEDGAAAERGEQESAPVFFVPETIHLSVQVETALEDIREIPAVLAIQSSGEDPDAKPETKPEMREITLKPDPNDPLTYLSPPIELVREGDYERFKDQPGVLVLAVKGGDTLVAMPANDTGYYLQPGLAKATIETTPDNLSALWKAALKQAADLAGQPIEDWDEVARGTTTTASNFIITDFLFQAGTFFNRNVRYAMNEVSKASGGLEIPMNTWIDQTARRNPAVRSTPISIGDHAAMLLLRKEFIKLMYEQHANWQRNQAPAAMRAIFETQKAAIGARQSPLSYVRVPIKKLQGYREISPSTLQAISLFFREDEEPLLHMLFSGESVSGKLRVDKFSEDFELVQWEAFKLAYAGWGALMRRAIHDASFIDDGDVHGLLKLTGMSFEPVVERLKPKLMKLDVDAKARRSRWVPDRVARAYVTSLGVLGAAVRAQKEVSEADTRVIQATAALASVALGNVSGVWAAAAAVGLSAADAAYAVYQDGFLNSARRDELQFEIGAGAVLGAERAGAAEGKILSTLEQSLSIGGSLVGLGADGAVFKNLKNARVLSQAELLQRADDILKNVDVADPAALRKLTSSLSKDQAAILLSAAEAAEAAAEAGRPTDLFQKLLDASLDKNDLLEKLVEGTNLAGISKKLEKVAESPVLDVDRKVLQETGKTIDGLIAETKAKISKLGDVAEGTPEYKQLDLLRGELDARKQHKIIVDAMEQPVVQVPKDVAKLLTGEAANFNKATLDDAVELLGGGRRFDGGNLEKVNLTAAGSRVDDLIEQTRTRIAGLAPDSAEIKMATRQLEELETTRESIRALDKSVGDAATTRISQRDLDLLNGRRSFDELDAAQTHQLILTKDRLWKNFVDYSKGPAEQQLLIHKVATHRRNLSHGIADEVIADIEKVTGKKGLVRNAFGSANLSSDYDVAFKGPGAELAVQEYNRRFRTVWGLESGAVLDNNFYTDPVYNTFRFLRSESGRRVTPAVLDSARQFFFQQMANAKYRTDGQFEVLRKSLLSSLPPEAGKFFSDLMDQAQGAKKLAQQSISERLKTMKKWLPPPGGEASKAVPSGLELASEADVLRATNDLYGDVLSSIHGYRDFVDDLDEVLNGLESGAAGAKGLLESRLPAKLRNTGMSKTLGDIQKLLDDPATRKAGLDALEKLRDRTVLNMRNEQGLALYYASEAYQSGDTIKHVVTEIQKNGLKFDPEGALLGQRASTADISVAGYINSYYENGANLIKELNAKHVLDESTGALKSGLKPDYLEKAAVKTGKYFVRQLDAAHAAGADLKELTDAPALLHATLELDAARDSAARFNDVLKKYGWTHEEYIRRALEAQRTLDSQVVTRSGLVGIAAEVGRAADGIPPWERQVALLGIDAIEAAERNSGAIRAAGASVKDAVDAYNAFFENTTGGVPGTMRVKREFQTALQGAHASGLRSPEIDQILSGLPSGVPPAQWADAASAALQQASLQRLSSSPVPSTQPSGLSAGARRLLGLSPAPAPGASPVNVSDLLRGTGGRVTTLGSAPPADVLRSHLAGGRAVLTLMDTPASNSRQWVRLLGIDNSAVRVSDPNTGEPVRVPRAVFDKTTRPQSPVLLVDPWRNTDGSVRSSRAGVPVVPADLDDVLPAVGR
ncbi:MAG: hypothetical protein R3F13_09205 [Prosthecobacter sp.]